MIYPRLDEIEQLVKEKTVNRRQHPTLPLYIHNYSASAQGIPQAQWSETLKDCRGLILDSHGEIIGRGFRKFWNYEQVLHEIPSEPFEVFEKLDGSLIIVFSYRDQRVVATRGSFESDQARWAAEWFYAHHPSFYPQTNVSWLFEGIFPANRIVVDYGSTEECVLLDVVDENGLSLPYGNSLGFREARRYDGVTDFSKINEDASLAGQEGFVVKYKSGFRCKCKLGEYKRLHRLITQCSTRTIWELLRSGKSLDELIDRVPEDFKSWVISTALSIMGKHSEVALRASEFFAVMPVNATRKEFAFCAASMPAPYPSMMFALLDNKPIGDTIWKLIEPRWATPFKKEAED